MRKPTTGLKVGRPALLAGALVVGSLATAGAGASAADAAASDAAASPNVTAPPSIGVEWFPTPNAGEQCGDGPTSQWATSPNWTTPILIDTDSRAGGCQLAFGIYDPGGALTGMTASYTWAVSSGGDAGQCQNAANGDNQGTFNLPIEPFQTFGSTVLDDTDNRSGYCNLTFTVSGLSGVGLDIQYYPQDDLADASQCRGYLPEGSYYTAYAGAPVTIGLDTDDRGGGCDLSLRIEHFGFGPVQHITKATSAK